MILHAALMVLSLGQPAKPDWPRLLHTLEPWAGGLAFSPDGKSLYAIGFDPDQPPPDRFRLPDRVINIWDVASGKQVAMLRGHKVARTLALSPDGKFLASAGNGIRLWERDSKKIIASTEEKPEWVSELAFSPDGKRLASGTVRSPEGHAVEIWDGNTLKPLPGLTDVQAVWGLIFSSTCAVFEFFMQRGRVRRRGRCGLRAGVF